MKKTRVNLGSSKAVEGPSNTNGAVEETSGTKGIRSLSALRRFPFRQLGHNGLLADSHARTDNGKVSASRRMARQANDDARRAVEKL